MHGRDKQRGVSRADFIGKVDDGDGPLTFEIVVIHGISATASVQPNNC
jgi:hypothetical protein